MERFSDLFLVDIRLSKHKQQLIKSYINPSKIWLQERSYAKKSCMSWLPPIHDLCRALQIDIYFQVEDNSAARLATFML